MMLDSKLCGSWTPDQYDKQREITSGSRDQTCVYLSCEYF